MFENEIKINFSRNIKELRISRKLNQIQLGEKINYTSKAISKWENGDVLPDVSTLSMLAEFFNVTIDDLISSKNIVRKSHKKLNRILTAISSSLLSFIIASVMFLILYLNHVPGAWKAFMVALTTSSITFVVFASLWFKRVTLNISILCLIWSISIMSMSFMDFLYYWILLIAGGILSITSIIFFNIRFTNRK